MTKKKTKDALKKIEKVKEVIPAADALDFFEKLTDAYTENQVTEREIAIVEAQKEILLQDMEKKYDLYYEIFDRVFDERKSAINKSFDIIDKGLDEGDNDLISMGLKSLSKVVSSSPFGDIQKLSSMLEGNKTIEI